MRYLGLDLGSKTLGISISDRTNTIASVYTTIYFKEDDPILDVNVFKDTLSDLRANNLKEFKYLNYSLEVSYIDSISLYLKVKYSLLFLERIKIYYFTYE